MDKINIEYLSNTLLNSVCESNYVWALHSKDIIQESNVGVQIFENNI